MRFTRQNTESAPIRVNKWLAQSGVCSRREAEALILSGLVTIDGETVTDPGRKIEPGQTLTLLDAAVSALETQLSVVLHKPVGFVSGQPEPDKIPAARLLTPARLVGSTPKMPTEDTRLPPIGRLDLDSRGLLLLSEDGVLAKALVGPESRLDKEYDVLVSGDITEVKIARLCHGLHLDGRALRPARVSQTGPHALRFILTEGRNRQIRRMCELVGLEVNDLLRTRIGPLHLSDLPAGHWRALTPEEREGLIAASQG
jgi:23S rRNA pseudouridine2604 synthase